MTFFEAFVDELGTIEKEASVKGVVRGTMLASLLAASGHKAPSMPPKASMKPAPVAVSAESKHSQAKIDEYLNKKHRMREWESKRHDAELSKSDDVARGMSRSTKYRTLPEKHMRTPDERKAAKTSRLPKLLKFRSPMDRTIANIRGERLPRYLGRQGKENK